MKYFFTPISVIVKTFTNQSVITGKSLPVDKGVGDDVSSGTVTQFGTFHMKATKVGENSSSSIFLHSPAHL